MAGPFTVESVSPHRRAVRRTRIGRKASGPLKRRQRAGTFEITIIDNLRKAGVQNTNKNERLAFDRLEPFAGAWLHAEGEYTDKAGASRRVAVSIDPAVRCRRRRAGEEAAKEALKGAGFDVLVVCGFTFDAHAGETAEILPDATPEGDRQVALGWRQGRSARPASSPRRRNSTARLPVMLARMNLD